MDSTEFRKLPAEGRIETASAKALDHINRPIPVNNRQRNHAKEWAVEACHAAYELHPELREEGSLIRYFVAKEGRKQGIYGSKLTEFVDQEFESGRWWVYVPPEVIKQSTTV